MIYFFQYIEMMLGYNLSLAISIAVQILGGSMLKDFFLKKQLCTKETEAEVIGYKEEISNEDDGNRISYYCRYKYCIDNISFEDVSKIGENSSIFAIGSKIILRYNPKNYSQHYIVGSSFSVTMILGGIFFIIMGLISFIFIAMGLYQRINSGFKTI